MQLLPKKPALTIIEVIVATTIFVVLATAGVMLLSEVSKVRQEVEMRSYLYTEMQAIVERISKEVQDNAIDYEEYYSWAVEGASNYVEHYGDYHAAFFSTYETGQNPDAGTSYGQYEANAVCGVTAGDCSDYIDYFQVNELYLINGTGTERIFFAIEEDSTGAAGDAVAMVKMLGTDTTGNSLIDTWECDSAAGYSCPHGTPNTGNLTDARDNYDFVPITPSNINIDSLYFYISPIEDPYKGYAETDPTIFESVQVQPKVTVVISGTYVTEGLDGPSITMQTTIGTGVYNKITTYKP